VSHHLLCCRKRVGATYSTCQKTESACATSGRRGCSIINFNTGCRTRHGRHGRHGRQTGHKSSPRGDNLHLHPPLMQHPHTALPHTPSDKCSTYFCLLRLEPHTTDEPPHRPRDPPRALVRPNKDHAQTAGTCDREERAGKTRLNRGHVFFWIVKNV
jgi:hypothetical protein